MDKSVFSVKHWQAPVVGLLGVWLAVSPWVLGLTGPEWLAAAHVAIGLALVASAAAMANSVKAGWGAWLTVVFGLVAAASPWLFGFAAQSQATFSALATGLVAAALGAVVGVSTMSDTERWWNDRVAH